MANCLFCFKADVLLKPSDSDWDTKIKCVGHPFFMEFNLHCEHWESFKNAHFCLACFARLEELQVVLRKIKLLQSDVTQLKQIIMLTVRRSNMTAVELTSNPGNTDFLYDICRIRNQLSLQTGIETWTPEFLHANRNITSTNNGSRTRKTVIVMEAHTEPEAGNILNGVTNSTQNGLRKSKKRRRSHSSPSSVKAFNCKLTKLDIEPGGSVSVPGISNNVNVSESQNEIIDSSSSSMNSNSGSSIVLLDVGDTVDASCQSGLRNSEHAIAHVQIGKSRDPEEEEPLSEQSSDTAEPEQISNLNAKSFDDEHFLTQNQNDRTVRSQSQNQSQPGQSSDSDSPPFALTYTVENPAQVLPATGAKNDIANEVSPFRSTYRVQDSNESTNKDVSFQSQEIWKCHTTLLPSSASGLSSSEDIESSFSGQLKLKPKHCSTINEESVLDSTGEEDVLNLQNDISVSEAIDENSRVVPESESDGEDEYHDSRQVLEVDDVRDHSGISAGNPGNNSILENRNSGLGRKRRHRKWKRRFDAPQGMNICSSRGCGSLWKTEDLLQEHIENDHNGELLQNHCELCLLKQKHFEPFPQTISILSETTNNESRMCHEAAEECAFKCDICPDTFLSVNCKEYHESRHRPRGSATFTRCSECKKNLDTPACLRNHIKLHNINLDCIPCKASFTNLLTLENHNGVYHDPYYESSYRRNNHGQKKKKPTKGSNGANVVPAARGVLGNPTTSLSSGEENKKVFQCVNCPKNFELEKYLFFHEQYCQKKKRTKLNTPGT